MLSSEPLVPRTEYGVTEDVSLQNRIANYLYHQHVPHSDELHVDAHLGTVVVSGKLASRHEKWLCLNTCQRVAGVVRLVDEVAVPKQRPKVGG